MGMEGGKNSLMLGHFVCKTMAAALFVTQHTSALAFDQATEQTALHRESFAKNIDRAYVKFLTLNIHNFISLAAKIIHFFRR